MPKRTPKNLVSAFELAQIAIGLCQLRNQKKPNPAREPGQFLRAAETLLADAQSVLNAPKIDAVARLLIRMGNANIEMYVRDGSPIPFDELLKPAARGQSSDKGTKKQRTHVGTITTMNGLEKSIRRYFSKADATRIIHAKGMKENEWRRILQAQENAIQVRAAKRVKE